MVIQWQNFPWKCSECGKQERPPCPCSGVIIGPAGWDFGFASTAIAVVCSDECKKALEAR